MSTTAVEYSQRKSEIQSLISLSDSHTVKPHHQNATQNACNQSRIKISILMFPVIYIPTDN